MLHYHQSRLRQSWAATLQHAMFIPGRFAESSKLSDHNTHGRHAAQVTSQIMLDTWHQVFWAYCVVVMQLLGEISGWHLD